MPMKYSQRMACERYVAKKRALGMRSRTLFATDNQWKIILPLSRFIKSIKIENLRNVKIDDEDGVITFETKEGAKLIDTEENQPEDDTTYSEE